MEEELTSGFQEDGTAPEPFPSKNVTDRFADVKKPDVCRRSRSQTVELVCHGRMRRMRPPKTSAFWGVVRIKKGHGGLFPRIVRLRGYCAGGQSHGVTVIDRRAMLLIRRF